MKVNRGKDVYYDANEINSYKLDFDLHLALRNNGNFTVKLDNRMSSFCAQQIQSLNQENESHVQIRRHCK